jgi:hypothetical protein
MSLKLSNSLCCLLDDLLVGQQAIGDPLGDRQQLCMAQTAQLPMDAFSGEVSLSRLFQEQPTGIHE